MQTMSDECAGYRIMPYELPGNIQHFAVFHGAELLALTHDRESAVLVRDDDIRRKAVSERRE